MTILIVKKISWPEVGRLLDRMRDEIGHHAIYGVPRGGAIVAGLLSQRHGIEIAMRPGDNVVIVDDILDSGATMQKYAGYQHSVMVNKQTEDLLGTWIQFPWEEPVDTDLEDNVRRILQGIGEDPGRPDLIETPRRLAKAWREMFASYREPQPDLKWFESDADEMVVVRGVTFSSTCEHHVLPFWGTAAVGYIPGGKVVGVSKIPRLVTYMSKKLQVQERLTDEIGKALNVEGVRGVGVSLSGQHMCMMARGVLQQSSVMETTYLSGLLKEDPAARAEFLRGVKT